VRLVGYEVPQPVGTRKKNGAAHRLFSSTDLAAQVACVLRARDTFAPLRARGRRTIVDSFDLKRVCLPGSSLS